MRSWMLSTMVAACVGGAAGWSPAAGAEEAPPGQAAETRGHSAGSSDDAAGASDTATKPAAKPQAGTRTRPHNAAGSKPGHVRQDVGPYELIQPPAEGSGPTDAQEQFELGQALLHGIDTKGRPHNDVGRPEEAFPWFLKAAEQGHPRAQANLGMAYLKGRGVEQNYDEALRWLDAAALQGSGKAMLELGLLYRDGDGVPKDPVRGVMWLLLAGQQGSLVANMVSSGSVKQLTPDQRREALRRAREWREEHGHPTLRREQKVEPAASQAASDEPTSEPAGPPS